MLLPSRPRPGLYCSRRQILTHVITWHRHSVDHRVCRRVTTESFAEIQALPIRPVPPKTSDPLRILFCGSDHFSCTSLAALNDLHKAQPQLIESIDVLTRPGKPAGRGLKRLAFPPLDKFAYHLGLPGHLCDSFTGWDLPLPGRFINRKTGEPMVKRHPSGRPRHDSDPGFNLLIAVSFGRLVPPRILKALKYGGLNVHPSFLPDLRGPAPIQWSILLNRAHTGCTLQTLHPKLFDRGTILLQTPRPGVPIPDGCTAAELQDTLAHEGANLLVQGLRENHHVPSFDDNNSSSQANKAPDSELDLWDAPKITKTDANIDWGSLTWGRNHRLYPGGHWTAADLQRRWRAVGSGMWTYATTAVHPREQRLIFEDIEAVACPPVLREAVRLVVQGKLALAAARGDKGDGESETETEALRQLRQLPPLSADVGSVVFSNQEVGTLTPRQFRVLMFLDGTGDDYGTSVVVPVRVPYRVVDGVVTLVEGGEFDAVRVRRIKVEGGVVKDAMKALGPYWERELTVEETAGMEYAMDNMAKRVD